MRVKAISFYFFRITSTLCYILINYWDNLICPGLRRFLQPYIMSQ